jgi:hypothetical protein
LVAALKELVSEFRFDVVIEAIQRAMNHEGSNAG